MAIELCQAIEKICPKYGVHVALTGGCLYKGGIRKDCDILFYRIRQCDNPDLNGLMKELENIGIYERECFGFCTKARYFELPLDIFYPEAIQGNYDEGDVLIWELYQKNWNGKA